MISPSGTPTILCLFFPSLAASFAPEEIPRVLSRIAHWALRFSPLCSVDTEGIDKEAIGREGVDAVKCSSPLARRAHGIQLDITGSLRMLGGVTQFSSLLHSTFLRRGLALRLAFAPTLGAAWALSRYSTEATSCVTFDTMRSALAPLPLRALRLSDATHDALHELNITRLEHLFCLAPRQLAQRFPPELTLRLCHMLGNVLEPFTPLRPAEHQRREILFEHVLSDHQLLLRAFSSALTPLLRDAESRGSGGAHILIELLGRKQRDATIALSIARPTTNLRKLERLFLARLEQMRLAGDIHGLAVTLSPLPQDVRSTSWLSHHSLEYLDDPSFSELFDLFKNTLGAERLCRATSHESHIPERSFHYRPILSAKKPKESMLFVQTHRPSLLLEKPRSIRAIAMLPDRPPSWLQIQHKGYRVHRAFGPERIAPEWWIEAAEAFQTRDYFTVQVAQGLWLWIFRSLGNAEWFLHGLWT